MKFTVLSSIIALAFISIAAAAPRAPNLPDGAIPAHTNIPPKALGPPPPHNGTQPIPPHAPPPPTGTPPKAPKGTVERRDAPPKEPATPPAHHDTPPKEPDAPPPRTSAPPKPPHSSPPPDGTHPLPLHAPPPSTDTRHETPVRRDMPLIDTCVRSQCKSGKAPGDLFCGNEAVDPNCLNGHVFKTNSDGTACDGGVNDSCQRCGQLQC